MGATVVGIYYRPSWSGRIRKGGLKTTGRNLIFTFLMGNFNHCGICWKDNTAGFKQSKRFLECLDDLRQVMKTKKERCSAWPNTYKQGRISCGCETLRQLWLLSGWRQVTSGVSQQLILELIFFNTFTDDLNAGTACSRFAEDTKLEGVANKPDGYGVIHRDQDRLVNWAVRNLPWFNKGKNNPMHQYTPRSSWLESSSAEKYLGVLLDSNLSMSHQCAT